MLKSNLKIQYLPEVGFLRLPDVLKIIPVSKSSWWAGVKSGKYPQPIKLGPRTTAWDVNDIRNFVLNTKQEILRRDI